MIERDWLMRQIRQLAQFLQQVLFQKQQGQVEQAHHTIQQAIAQVDEDERDNLRRLSLPETVQFCRRDGLFRPEFATHVADLLKEEGDLLIEQGNEVEAKRSYTRALLLYRRAMKEEGAAMPWNIRSKLSDLKAKVEEERVEEVERVLENEAPQ